MNYIKITRYDTANGIGIRDVLWVAGCEHHCEGCHNFTTWDKDQGKPITKEVIEGIVQDLQLPYFHGLTLSGGDPLATYNRKHSTQIAKTVKERCPDKTIWCYTGYLWEELIDQEILQYLDVLVDGKFVLSERNLMLPYCGSNNQRVIDVSQSMEHNKIILFNPSP